MADDPRKELMDNPAEGPYKASEGNSSYTREQLLRHLDALESGKAKDAALHYDADRRLAVQQAFLQLLMNGGTVNTALRHLNETRRLNGDHLVLSRSTLYVWRNSDPEFREAWDEAYDMGTDHIEEVAEKFALEGNAALLQFLLKIRNNKRYNLANRVEGEVKANVGVTFTFKLDSPNDNRLDLEDDNDNEDTKLIEGDFERLRDRYGT